MIQNHRPYQLMYSKTGSRVLAGAVAYAARLCGMADLAIHGLHSGQSAAQQDAEAARAAVQQLCPKPQPEGEVPPLPPRDEAVDLSVIVPSYNAEKFIDDCMESILGQDTHYTLQVIVVDGGSRDRTMELLKKYQAQPRVIITEVKSRSSAAKARNDGLLYATGRYVMFVDSDDRLYPGAVQALMDAAQQKNADIVQGGWQYIDEEDVCGLKQQYANAVYTGAKRLDRLDLPGVPWGKIYRRELFEKIRFPSNYSCFEDTVIHFLVFRKAETVASVPALVYLWRKNPAGLTARNQHRPSAVQSYWIVEEMLAQDAAQGLPHDALFSAVLTMQLSNYCYATLRQAEETTQRSVFALCCDLYAKNLPQGAGQGQSYAVRCGAKALLRRDFALWCRQGRRFQLL